MSTLYLRQWSAASRRSMARTPDLFAHRQFQIFGIRRALTKLGADLIIDLETLNAQEVEQMRVDIAAQFRRRKAATTMTMKENS